MVVGLFAQFRQSLRQVALHAGMPRVEVFPAWVEARKRATAT